ncbi:SRPBCC domain-containing protein [Flavobacterium sp. NG2]|uniref:SRPBCC domain-containing protein n=1 Tax=Flavobacterium sp. NG2 TaxID=3097547 RepID=UPI002A7EBA12|nr:SRPBCC domain-containing protein [Flavobacterium sp. NG2]WPR70348.1 SRPBCC domain-containing protein [Flavobacterium sp. NG2]
MENKNIIIERVFNAPLPLVWKALTEKELMKQWYFDLEEFKVEIGFKFQFTGGPSPEKQYVHLCKIVEVIQEQKLAYTWRYEGFEGNSLVIFELIPVNENQTKLKLTHSGIETFPQNNPDFAIGNFEAGWNAIVNTNLKDFLEPNFKNNFTVNASADVVFDALINRIPDWWTEDFSGSSNKINDEFTVRFGSTFKTMKILELIPNQKIVWLCTDTLIAIPELPHNTEWKDTKIIWELENKNLETTISLTHVGLTPQSECYEICEQGWNSFVQSLKQLSETNTGLPFKKE